MLAFSLSALCVVEEDTSVRGTSQGRSRIIPVYLEIRGILVTQGIL